jgi:hypothetical protein
MNDGVNLLWSFCLTNSKVFKHFGCLVSPATYPVAVVTAHFSLIGVVATDHRQRTRVNGGASHFPAPLA